MSKQRYPEEFKTEAAKQITERGHKVADVSARLGVSQHSLYQWIRARQMSPDQRQAQGPHPSGYYAWKAGPASPRAQDDHRSERSSAMPRAMASCKRCCISRVPMPWPGYLPETKKCSM